MSKLQDYLKAQGVDPRRIISASKNIENLRDEDRGLRLARRQYTKNEKKGDAPAKPRSGKPVNAVTLSRALGGKSVSGSAKTRILRAINALLEQKKKPQADLKSLFS